MISDQKHKCEKAAKYGINGFSDKRVKMVKRVQVP